MSSKDRRFTIWVKPKFDIEVWSLYGIEFKIIYKI